MLGSSDEKEPVIVAMEGVTEPVLQIPLFRNNVHQKVAPVSEYCNLVMFSI
jgi:hypothetical protein